MIMKDGKVYYPLEFGYMTKSGKVYYDRSERKKPYFYLDFTANSVLRMTTPTNQNTRGE